MMEKNRTKKGEASRSRLMEAAVKQFAEAGYHAAKVSDIVKAAGLTQAAFYLYFPSKEALFAELVGEYRTHLKQLANAGSLVTPLSPAEVPEQVKENVVRLFMFLSASPQLSRIALLESPEKEAIKQEIQAMITQNLLNNQRAGHVRRNLPSRTAAECMVAVFERMVVKLIEEQADPAELAGEIADVMLYGLLGR